MGSIKTDPEEIECKDEDIFTSDTHRSQDMVKW